MPVFKKILRFICVACTVICVICSIAFSLVNRLLYSDDIIPQMADEEYVAYMHDRIETALIENEAYYGFDCSYLTRRIDDVRIKRICDTYFHQLHEYLLGRRTQMDPVYYPATGFRAGVREFADTLEDKTEQFSADAADEIARDAADIAAACIPIAPEKYLSAVKDVLSSPQLIFVNSYYIMIIAALLFASLCVFIPGNRLKPKLTLAASSFFVPSFGLLVFFYMAYRYDFGNKIVIAESPLRQFILRYIGQVFSVGIWTCVLYAAISGIVMVTLLIIRSIRIVMRRRQYTD